MDLDVDVTVWYKAEKVYHILDFRISFIIYPLHLALAREVRRKKDNTQPIERG